MQRLLALLRAALPWALVFHPKGPFKKAGPWIALALAVAALPLLLVPEARQRAIGAVAPVDVSVPTAVPTPLGPGVIVPPATPLATDGQRASAGNPTGATPPTQGPQSVPPQGVPEGFNPLAQTGAWAISGADVDRAKWTWARARAHAAGVWEAQMPGDGFYTSFYCGCTIARSGDSGGDVDLASCGYEDHGNLNRARRMEWEHIVPASRLGQGRACWTTGLPACRGADGTMEAGRDCCEQADPLYQMMSNDPVNLAPSIGEVNGLRSNHPFGDLPDGVGITFGARCGMAIDSSAGIAEPPDRRKGDVARVTAYMSRAYGLPVSAEEAATLSRWMALDPVSEEEIAINRAIAASGHRPNPFVLDPTGASAPATPAP